MKNNNGTNSDIDRHLVECLDCSKQSELMDKMLESLADHTDAFCPPVEQLYEFARTGEDPSGSIAFHVDQCESCRNVVTEYRASMAEGEMPDRVRSIFDLHLSKRSGDARAHEQEGIFSRISTMISSLLGPIGMSLAAATAAAVLLVVLIYPRGATETVMGLSSVGWEKHPELSFMSPSPVSKVRPRVATILFFKGFQVPQKTIDALYNVLKPDREIGNRFEILSPGQVRKSLIDRKIEPDDRKALLKRLRTSLSASRVIMVTILREGERYLIRADLIDSSTGSVLNEVREDNVQDTDLSSKLRDAVVELLK